MISQKRFIAGFVSLVLLFILANAATFLVRGIEQVVVVRMGKIVRVIDEDTGLYFKWPMLEEVVRLDKRIMSMTSSPIRVPTSGNEFITLSTVAKWRIADPVTFIRTAKTEAAGAELLDQILTASVRSQTAQLTMSQIIGGALIMSGCPGQQSNCSATEKSNGFEMSEHLHQYGIDLKDFRILRVSHTTNVRTEVENRMISERLHASERVYEEGEIASANIAADTDLQVQRILSKAQQYHDQYLVETERDILTQLTSVYRKDPQFYTFFETVQAYQKALGNNTTLMIPTDSDFFHFLKGDSPQLVVSQP